ncbi:MAG: endonuclease III domain-containing protein [Anaerolineae bacterium]|jgi:endonuclease-3 related protein|nr:endonuclease [Chloroflexota bacterium]
MTAPPDAKTIFGWLLSMYGNQNWWPGRSPVEIMVGAILTQRTSWRNVTLAISELDRAGLLSLTALLQASPDTVRAAIRPAGFANVKYRRLMSLLQFVAGSGDLPGLAATPTDVLASSLRAVPGVGPETADSILLYALNRPVFVVDAYARRLLERLGNQWARAPYPVLQRWFQESLPTEVALLGEYHALIVAHGKARCRVRPRCTGCLAWPQCPLGQ